MRIAVGGIQHESNTFSSVRTDRAAFRRPPLPVSLHRLISLGIVPERQRILVVKSGSSHRPAYEPVAQRTIEADTPGITAADPRHFTYQRVRRPIWPVDDI